MLENTKHNIVKAAGLVGFFTLLSRFVGLFRDRIFASTFGAGNILDSYYAAFRIPDLLFNLLVLGTLSVAFIPVFTEYFLSDSKEAIKISNTVLNVGFLGMSILCLILYFFVPELTAHFIAPGFTGQKLADTITLTKIFLLSPIIFTVSSVFSSVLNSLKRFLIVSLAPILYNFGIIFGVVFFYPHFGIKGLAYGVIFGALMHLFLQFFALLFYGYKYNFEFNFRHPGVLKIAKLFAPRIIGVDSSQISLLIASIIGSFLSAGSIAIFNFANNLQAVPIGIFAVSFAVASFPNLSEAYAKHDQKDFSGIFLKTVLNVLFFIIPISILMFLLRTEIVKVVYGAGQFDAHAISLTASALGIFIISIFAQSLTPLFSRAFYARQNTVIPVLVGLLTLGLNIVLSFYLGRMYGVVGLASGFTIATIINAAVLYLILYRKLQHFNNRYLFGTTFKIVVCSAMLAAATYFSLWMLQHFYYSSHTLYIFLEAFIAGTIGIGVFLLSAAVFKLEQVASVSRVVKQRFFK